MTHTAAHRYIPLVRWSDEDACYIGSCPPLIGECCHGSDPAKVMRELTVIMDEHLAILDADGEAYPPATNKAYSGTFALRIGVDLHRALAVRAAAAGDSLNQYIERTLATAIRPGPKRVRATR